MSKLNISNNLNKKLNKTKNDIWFSNSCGGDIDSSFQNYIVQKYYKKECKNTLNTKKWQKCSDIGFNVAYQDKYTNDVYLFLKKNFKKEHLFVYSYVKKIKSGKQIPNDLAIGCILDFLNHFYLNRNKNPKPIINYIGKYITNLYKLVIDTRRKYRYKKIIKKKNIFSNKKELEQFTLFQLHLIDLNKINKFDYKNKNIFSKLMDLIENEYKKELKIFDYFNSLFKTNRKAPISTPTLKIGTKRIGIDLNEWKISIKNNTKIWLKI